MKIGSLFSGIGGLELGLEWAGVGHTVFQVEQDDYCRRVLAKHWPDAQRFTDVKDVGAHCLPNVDVICGGFPCQDISNAGRKAGINGERSGLWQEFRRTVEELSPRYVVVENVGALATRGIGAVVDGLRRLGYDGERLRISSADLGADHERERLFVVAYADGERQSRPGLDREDASHHTPPTHRQADRLVDAVRRGALPFLCREDHGLPWRMERLTALGNAVDPRVACVVGRRLLEIDAQLRASA